MTPTETLLPSGYKAYLDREADFNIALLAAFIVNDISHMGEEAIVLLQEQCSVVNRRCSSAPGFAKSASGGLPSRASVSAHRHRGPTVAFLVVHATTGA
jgi:hypothetical protein